MYLSLTKVKLGDSWWDILVDTTRFKSEIWKYLTRVAVFFETIHHEGAARVVYGLKKHCYPSEIFPYFTRYKCCVFITQQGIPYLES